jgi:hypothetical protein
MRDKDARSWCRIGEALALDWSNVRLHEQSARIGMSKNGETPGHSIAIRTFHSHHYANFVHSLVSLNNEDCLYPVVRGPRARHEIAADSNWRDGQRNVGHP